MKKNKLETPNFAYSNFNNIHIGGCAQILDPPQNLGGERCKFGKLFENVKIKLFFDIFWDILNKMKDNLGQEYAKGGFYPFRAKIKQFPLISLEK